MSEDTTEEARRTQRERTLSTGEVLRLEIEGGADASARIDRALNFAEAALAAERPSEAETSGFGGIVGASPPMTALFKMLERIKNSDATVLVLGDNGTGKELVARAIHRQSRRADRAFVATNCSAFNDNLLESELFGHRRGSFTGAVADKPGLFQVADGGTFFMDEVGDMSPALQVKLLRVLQEGVFMPVGGTEHREVDVRIIAATNRDLSAMVREGTFREDLYYRLHVVSLKVPALRERKEDIPLLVRHFLSQLEARDGHEKVLTPRALAQLVEHDWPGNVRELENEMERVWVLSGEDRVIDEEVLSPHVRRRTIPPTAKRSEPPPAPGDGSGDEPIPEGTLPEAVEALERRMIAAQLEHHRGNKTRAAASLGISRRNLIRKVQGYGLEDVGRGRRRGG